MNGLGLEPLAPRHKYPLPPPPPKPPKTLPARWQSGVFSLFIRLMVYFTLLIWVWATFFWQVSSTDTTSMEPTILGGREKGDRFVISRLHYQLDDPKRWEIVLFHYPHNISTRYLKRLVGLGAEQLFIDGGDLYAGDLEFSGSLAEGLASGRVQILRKPAPVQTSLVESFPLLSEDDLTPFDEQAFKGHFEVPTAEAEAWTSHGSWVTVQAPTPTLAKSTEPVGFDGRNPAERAQRHARGWCAVGDLSWRVDVRPHKDASAALLHIRDTAHDQLIVARLAVSGSELKTTVHRGQELLGESDATLAIDAWSPCRLDNIDDRITLFIDGDPVISATYEHPPVGDRVTAKSAGPHVAFGTDGGTFDLRPRALHRDIHYINRGQVRFLIPKDHYVFLGDNSAASADSRVWERTAIQVLATGAILEGDSQGVSVEHALAHGDNPWREPDGTWTFCDASGGLHPFATRSDFRRLGKWPAPYVPRDRVVGRGVFLFSPFSRFQALR